MSATSRYQLLTAAQQFCDAFSQKKDVKTLLSFFSTKQTITAIEHGDPSLAPFLGRPHTGRDGIKTYFELISSLLSYEDMRFSEFIADGEARKVACKGQARFTWISTNQSWDETFAYMLDFDEDCKIVKYQVWADSGAAYLARKGWLGDQSKVV